MHNTSLLRFLQPPPARSVVVVVVSLIVFCGCQQIPSPLFSVKTNRFYWLRLLLKSPTTKDVHKACFLLLILVCTIPMPISWADGMGDYAQTSRIFPIFMSGISRF